MTRTRNAPSRVHDNYPAARAALPQGARWEGSYGYPGEVGYAETWRAPSGAPWLIACHAHWAATYWTATMTTIRAPSPCAP